MIAQLFSGFKLEVAKCGPGDPVYGTGLDPDGSRPGPPKYLAGSNRVLSFPCAVNINIFYALANIVIVDAVSSS